MRAFELVSQGLLLPNPIAQRTASRDARAPVTIYASARGDPVAFITCLLYSAAPGKTLANIDYKGSVLIEADDGQIEGDVERLVAKGVESVAVCLLWSIANDAHEKEDPASFRTKARSAERRSWCVPVCRRSSVISVFLHSGLRTEVVFFGQQDRDTRMPIPEHISARPVDGMVAFDRPAARQLAPVS